MKFSLAVILDPARAGRICLMIGSVEAGLLWRARPRPSSDRP